MPVSKKKVIKSLETISEDLRELVKKQYPNGYEQNISRILNAKNEPIFVFPLETEDATYLIKVPVTKNSEGGYEVESANPEEDPISNPEESDDYSSGSDEFGAEAEGDNYEESEDGGKSREASYDPDFDN
jgi:hypothetical protein